MQNKYKTFLALIAILGASLLFSTPSYAEELTEIDAASSSQAIESVVSETSEQNSDAETNGTASQTSDDIEEPLTYSGEDGTYIPDMPDGWWRDEYYVVDNKFVSGFQTIEGITYYFDPNTKILQKGQLKIDGYWYFFNSKTGAMAKSEFVELTEAENPSDGKTVYYDQNGHMLYGIQNIGGKFYYLKEHTGALQKGQQKIGKFWYYFNSETGAMAKSKFINLTKEENNSDAKTVYYDQNGHMLYGIQNIGGKFYYLKEHTGALQKGHLKVGGYWYYFDKATGAAKKSEFYTLQKGESGDAPKTVYFDQNGHLLYGLRKINNNYYYFKNGSGALQKNTLSKENNRTYRTDKNGIVYETTVVDVPYYAQYDREWGNTRVGSYTIKSSGCSVMVGTSIINFITGREDHPQYIAFRFHDDFNSYNSNGIFGTTSDIWRKVAKDYDMRFESGMNYVRIQDHLRQGHLVKTSVKAGTFVNRGTHALLLMGLDSNNRTYVYDPNNKGQNGWYSLDTIWNEQSTHSDDTRDGGPFFALWR